MSTQVDDCYSGHEGECVTCGKPIQIPEFATSETVNPSKKKSPSIVLLVTAAVIVVLLSCLLVVLIRVGGQTVKRMSTTRGRSASVDNLRRIATALNAYANDHGSYPPPVLQVGRNQHSWRVLILPYLGESAMYSEYNLDEPWDSDRNQQLGYNIPSVFRNPQELRISNGLFSMSDYYLITGAGTVFPSSGPLTPKDINDEHGKTLLVVEGTPAITGSGLWTEPIDLQMHEIQASPGVNRANGLGGLLDGGFAVVTVDGTGHFLSDSIPPSILNALITANGGERLTDDVFD